MPTTEMEIPMSAITASFDHDGDAGPDSAGCAGMAGAAWTVIMTHARKRRRMFEGAILANQVAATKMVKST